QILQESLAIYGLDLKMRQRKLFIDGDEAQIRSAILNLLPMFNQLDLEQITQNKVQPLDGELAHFCLGLLITLERELGVNIPYPYNINIFSHLYIFISRNRRSTSIHVVAPSKPTIVDEKIYSVCQKIIQEIEQYFKMKVDAVEIDYLYQYVVSSRLQKPFSSGKLPFSQRVLDVTHYYFSRMCMDNREIETTDPDFVDLASHISPLLRRLDNRVQIKNSLLSQILLTYPNLVKELTTISKEVSLVFGFASLSLDEIGFLVLYFARFQEKRARPLKTVVMCTSGVGTSELLRARLEKQFTELDIIDVVAYHQLDELINLYPDLDFIVTTVALQEPASVPFVLVSVFLTEGDKQRLQAKIQEINYE
ncbi:BglG family transcription antiterminator, partial [Streptococcus pneumoniae]